MRLGHFVLAASLMALPAACATAPASDPALQRTGNLMVSITQHGEGASTDDINDLAAQLFVGRLGSHAINTAIRVTLVDDQNIRFTAEIRAFCEAILVNVEHDHGFLPAGFERPHVVQPLKKLDLQQPSAATREPTAHTGPCSLRNEIPAKLAPRRHG